MEEIKRKRGRPRKYPLNEPILLSIGIERKHGTEKGLFSTFVLQTQGSRVLAKKERQADIKTSSLDTLYLEMLEHFVVGDV